MAYNAIPYKKSKITDESKLCFRAKKSPKIPKKTLHSFAGGLPDLLQYYEGGGSPIYFHIT